MKNSSATLFHFTGYPLRVADVPAKTGNEPKKSLKVIKVEKQPVVVKNQMADNPKNWDESWFCNYE